MAALFDPPKPAEPDPALIQAQKDNLAATTAAQTAATEAAKKQQQTQDTQLADDNSAKAAGYRGYQSLLSGGYTGFLGGTKSLLGTN